MKATGARRIAIVGGSITGCAAAIELSRAGFEVVLFERSGEELKDRGAGIGIPPTTIKTLVERDLIGADLPYFNAKNFVRRWRTEADRRYGYLAWEQPTAMLLMNWGMLYRHLRARVPAGVYRTHHRVESLNNSPTGVQVALANGTQENFDLVICADGYMSLGRRTLHPGVTPNYAGYVLWRGGFREAEIAEREVLASGVHALGYPGGHGIFYYVPGIAGQIGYGERLINWGMYVPVPAADLNEFLTDVHGRVHEGSLPPGAMPRATEDALKQAALVRIPDFYAEIVTQSVGTYVYTICDCQVPSYRDGRICLMGDAGAFARPHSGAGALKGMTDAIALRQAFDTHDSFEDALTAWNVSQTEHGNRMVKFGNQLGQALVREIPDWSTMDVPAMERWFNSMITIGTEVFGARKE